ncbi:hypothetical protein, partial [Psychromonas antarctica]|uniref:hypothetical protein n=1 Tax=Psychromonas antarctica TaxID=67573 RepID=UPI001EE7E173
GLASAGMGKVVTNAGKLGKLTPSKTKLPAGLHNQEWEKVHVPEGKFKTLRAVDMKNLSEADGNTFSALKDLGWKDDKIEEILSSGKDFRTKELQAGDKLYGLTTKGRPKNIETSAYWLDEEGLAAVKKDFYKDGIWDKDGIKNSLALPCFNRANAMDVVEITEPTSVVESTLGKASELIQYTADDGYSTGLIGKIMPGGGTQITPNPKVLIAK